MALLVDQAHVLRHMHLEDATEEEKREVELLQAAAESYLLGGGCIKSQATDGRFQLTVCALTLHWHDHRELVSDSTNPMLIPLGAASLITQLKAEALMVSNSDTGGEDA